MDDKLAIIILAAGMGTRMKSNLAKVLHRIHGKPMIQYVVGAARAAAGENIVVVVGHQADEVRRVVSKDAVVRYAVQEQQLGTGHAVMCALPVLPPESEEVVILCGDVPLIRTETIVALVEDHRAGGRDLTVLAVDVPDPTGYGRIISCSDHQLMGIVEEADATDIQRKITLINSGIYCTSKSFLTEMLPKLRSDNAQHEFYLTDIIGIGYDAACKIGMLTVDDYNEIIGVNTLKELGIAANLMSAQDRIIT
jgi:UDP-N-acetylglucosamine diphosphorylase/glucosamine-1-phosphate N-acetyltransferase